MAADRSRVRLSVLRSLLDSGVTRADILSARVDMPVPDVLLALYELRQCNHAQQVVRSGTAASGQWAAVRVR